MRVTRLLILLLVLLLPAAALADKTITITFTGDITLGGEDYLQGEPTSFASVYAQNGPEYFLSNFADFFAEDDLTVVNLEGVLTDNESLPTVQEGKTGSYFFRGPTEYVSVLTAASVEAASLANNHALDYGEEGLRDTIATLEAAGIEWFGTHDWHRNDTEKFHGGQEDGRHRTRPQQVFTKMALGAGADLVICHHAHVVMGMDVIGNRSAVYSLGNFCFGGNKNAYQKSSKKVQDAAPALIVRAVLTFDDEGNYKGQQLTLYPVQTTSVDRNGASEQPNNYQPKFITGPLGAHVLHLMQVDMNYDLKNAQNRELKNIVTAKEEELAAMESSEGMSSLTLPYLPAEE